MLKLIVFLALCIGVGTMIRSAMRSNFRGEALGPIMVIGLSAVFLFGLGTAGYLIVGGFSVWRKTPGLTILFLILSILPISFLVQSACALFGAELNPEAEEKLRGVPNGIIGVMPKPSLALLLLLPTLAAAQNFSERYTYEPGFDRPGSDYETFEQTSEFQSHELCRDACFSQPKCKSYTYVKPGVAGPKPFCRLKDSEPAPVENACCISAVKGGKPKQRAVPSLKLQWLGWDQDKVGKDRNPNPDGAPDHRFVLELTLGMETDIISVSLRTSDDQGIVHDKLLWSSDDKDGELLAVEAQGQRLNSPHGLGGFRGNVKLDLYAHDIGQWMAGGHVLVEVLLGDGRRLKHWTALAPPPDRLIGIAQMHCQSTSPQAFEPMTLSDRLQLTLLEDGSIRGWFGSRPVTGRIAEGGALTATAKTGEELVEFSGKLDQPRRGKPLRGSGGFRVVKSPDLCKGEGMWSSQ